MPAMTAVRIAPSSSLSRIDWPSVLREVRQLIERERSEPLP
jgi:hypothetical protein